VQVVLLSTALAPLGVPLISPALPVVRDTFALTDARASLLVSGYFVVGIFLSPFIGLLADKLGRRRMLVVGLLVFGSFGGAMAVAPTFDALLALRVLQGTGAAAIFITTVTIISDTFEGPQRNTVLGINIAVLSAGAALYPVLGGVLVTLAWNAPFLAYLGAIPVALFAAVALEEPRRSATPRSVDYLTSALGAVAAPSTLALFGLTFLTEFLAFGVVFTAVPFLLAATVSPVIIGATLLAAEATSMLVAALGGRLAQVLSNERILAVGFGCYGVGFLGTWLAPSVVGIAVALVVVGAGIGALLPAVDAALSERVPGEYRAGAFSLRNSTTFAGRAGGPIVFAGLAITFGYGYDPLLLAAGIVALLTAGSVLLVAGRTGRE
jgi:MFS family permease